MFHYLTLPLLNTRLVASPRNSLALGLLSSLMFVLAVGHFIGTPNDIDNFTFKRIDALHHEAHCGAAQAEEVVLLVFCIMLGPMSVDVMNIIINIRLLHLLPELALSQHAPALRASSLHDPLLQNFVHVPKIISYIFCVDGGGFGDDLALRVVYRVHLVAEVALDFLTASVKPDGLLVSCFFCRRKAPTLQIMIHNFISCIFSFLKI